MRSLTFIVAIVAVALSACSSPPKSAPKSAAREGAMTFRQPTSALSEDQCWEKMKATNGDAVSMARVRVECEGHLSEAFDVLAGALQGEPSYKIRFINFSRPLEQGGYDVVSTAPVGIGRVRAYLDIVRGGRQGERLPFGTNGTLQTGYGQILLVTPQGAQAELASVESYLMEKGQACLRNSGGSSACDEGVRVDIGLDWAYNSAIGYSYLLEWEGAKFGGSERKIVRWEDGAFRTVRSVTELVPEQALVAALKTDWLVRNADVYPALSRATNLREFMSAMRVEPGRPESRKFQSHSSRLSGAKLSTAVACARAYDDPRKTAAQRGFACLRANNVIRYDYFVDNDAFQKNFAILRVTPTHVRVRVAYSVDPSSVAFRVDVPVSNAGSYLHYVSASELGERERAEYSAGKCQIGFPGTSMVIEASRPQLVSPRNECNIP